MNNRVCPINIEPIDDTNLCGVEQEKDKITISEKVIEHSIHWDDEPIHCKVPVVKSLGEILQSDFKYLFERRHDNE